MEESTHPLEQWRAAEGLRSKAEAARQLGIPSTQYCDVVSGRTELSAARMRQVIDRTCGSVTAESLVHWKNESTTEQQSA